MSRRPPHALILSLPILAAAGGLECAAQPAAPVGPPAPERPKYRLLRFEEDWSVLAAGPVDGTGDLWDPVKYVPLSDDGSVWASFGGRARARAERWHDFGFGRAPDNDDTFALYRLFLHGDLHVGPGLRLFVEGKTAQSTERDLAGGRRGLDADSLDLEQAFADLSLGLDGDWSLTLRPGRQTFAFGRQRLVSPLPWVNTQRRWDGVSAILAGHGWTVHGFWTQFVPVKKHDFNDPDAQTAFFGAYATGAIFDTGVTLDLYALGLDRDDPVTFNGTTGDEERYTLGGRLSGAIGDLGLDYDLEGAYQLGEVGEGDVDAFMVGAQVGWSVPDTPGGPRIFAGFDYGSGDEAAGGDVGTFNQLFPLGHAHLGFIDAVGRQNVIDLSAGMSFEPVEKLSITLAGHLFWRARNTDALYGAGGGPVAADAPSVSRKVGQELDLTIRYRFDRHLSGLFGYSHFRPDDFVRQTTPGGSMDFFYAQLEYTF